MNLYANWLHDVGKLVYIIGNFTETAQLKKILDPVDPRNRIYFRTYQEFPANALRKIKITGVREGILRADWLNKILERYPEMVIFLFNLGEETEVQKVEVQLRQILRKINLFYADVLKQNIKEDVIIRIIVTMTKPQAASPMLMEKVTYYMKSYQKDSFVIQIDNLGKEIARFRVSWLSYLEKNYQKKLRKLNRKLQQTVSNDKKLGLLYKIALISEVIGKDDRQRYNELLQALRYKFSDITKKDFNFMKYLEIRQIRILADVTVLRFIKHRFITNTKEIPQFVQGHLNYFKMRSMEPNTCHFYFYHEELVWRSAFLQQVLEVLGAADLIQLLPPSIIAEWVNGLLSYLLKLANVPETLLNDLQGKLIDLSVEHYLGRYNFMEATDADMVMTGTTELIKRRKDYISKGIQLITRFKNAGLFKQNQINFLNIFLIRFYLADSKFAAITNIYNEILKVQVNRCNYFLINQLFNEIQAEMPKIDSLSRKFIYGVTSLICDYFENYKQLQKYLELFFNQKVQEILHESSPQRQGEKSLFSNELSPEAHIFKLKKNSSIFTSKVLINQQIILGNEKYKIKFKFIFGELLHRRLLLSKNLIQIKFNHNGMVYDIPLQINQNEALLVERELQIEPLFHVRRDNSLQIQEVQLVMENKNLVWVLQRNQLSFEKYDSTVFHTKISQPEVLIEDIKKVYYLNQMSHLRICIRGLQGCKISAKLSVTEDDPEGKTQFYMNKDQKLDMTNSKKQEQLLACDKQNFCWIKFTKLNNKILKLNIVAVVQKSFEVGWREKAVNLKSTYSIVKQIQFEVKHLFTITKTFREAVTGAVCVGGIPINKKILLSVNIKANDKVELSEVDYHKNPRKIKYHKCNKLTNLKLLASQSVNTNLLFQINQDCSQQIELFLMTLFISWQRPDSGTENVFVDEATTINAKQDKISISFQQKNTINQRKKGSLFVKVTNLTTEPTNIYIMMQSTQNLLRIGEKGKWQKLGAYQRVEVEFNVLSIRAGIFDFPSVKAFLYNTEVTVSTANILVHCE